MSAYVIGLVEITDLQQYREYMKHTPRLINQFGGRFVARGGEAVTLEGERALLAFQARYGGEVCRIGLAHAEPIGRLTGWRPTMPVTQLVARR